MTALTKLILAGKGTQCLLTLTVLALVPIGTVGAALGLEPFVPNDPYFFTGNPAGFPGQWHLDKQTSGAVIDANVAGAWARGWTGQGVTIGIVDDGVEYTHPDLSANYVASQSWDFWDNDPDPYPIYATSSYPILAENHGTAVVGVAAARGANGIGVTGAAPYASFASLRVGGGYILALYEPQNDSMFAAATLYHANGGSGGVQIKNHSYNPTHPYAYVNYPLMSQAIAASAAQGTINCVIAGNYRQEHGVYYMWFTNDGVRQRNEPGEDADAGKKTICNLPEAIVVAATGSDGKFASYSGWGACVSVTSPSRGSAGTLGITTTDRQGTYGYSPSGSDPFPDPDYRSTFGGTSSATPLVSGILALAKQAQPALDTRFAKHLLAATSQMIDPTDATPMGGWRTNAAGIHFNNNYGFGLIDADALTLAATHYSSVTPLVTQQTGTIPVSITLPMFCFNGFGTKPGVGLSNSLLAG